MINLKAIKDTAMAAIEDVKDLDLAEKVSSLASDAKDKVSSITDEPTYTVRLGDATICNCTIDQVIGICARQGIEIHED